MSHRRRSGPSRAAWSSTGLCCPRRWIAPAAQDTGFGQAFQAGGGLAHVGCHPGRANPVELRRNPITARVRRLARFWVICVVTPAGQKKAHLMAGKMRVNAFENLHPAAPTSKLPGVAHAMKADGLIRHYGIHIAGSLIVVNHFDARRRRRATAQPTIPSPASIMA